MTQINQPVIKLLEHLTTKDYEEITALQDLCEKTDGLAFKLELDFKMSQYEKKTGGIGEINEFLYCDGDRLIGYIGVCGFGGEELEVSGMTHPEYRGMGVFTRLFSLVRGEIGRRGAPALLLCDSRSEAGLTFIGKAGTAFDHAEREMVWKAFKASPAPLPRVLLRKTEGESLGTFAAEAEGREVGSVRLELTNGTGGLYAVEVQEQQRGMGYGKALVQAGVELLREAGAREIRLQVDEENARAQHVYDSCGFETLDTMEYYLLK